MPGNRPSHRDWTVAICAALLLVTVAVFLSRLKLGPANLVWLSTAATVAFLVKPSSVRGGIARRSILVAAGLLGIAYQLKSLRTSLLDPGSWDYLCFFLDGHVIAGGLNPYEPSNYRQVFSQLALPLTVDPYFDVEILKVGFKYPPWTMLLFAPLGFMTFKTGLAVWLTAILSVPAIVSIFLIRRELRDESSSVTGLAYAAVLVTLAPASLATTSTEQTLFLCLATLLLMIRFDRRAAAGLAAGMGVLVKPLLIIGPAYLLFSGRHRAFAVSMGVLAALAVVTAALFGVGVFQSYLGVDFIAKVPLFQYSESVNQSLLAVVLRTLGENPEIHPMLRSEFRIGAVAIVAVTIAAACWVRYRKRDELLLGLILAGALLVYPGSMTSYGVLTLVPLVPVLARVRDVGTPLPGGAARKTAAPRLIIATTALFGTIMTLQSSMGFVANLIVWLGYLLMAWYSPSGRVATRSLAQPIASSR